jgi:2-oxoacid:acceptor oxidoreductase delta subunit (pyruvate/2-ketoisovalerate family)
MKEQKIVRKFDEMVDLVRERDYAYLYRPEYVEDLGKGPRMCACQGAPASSGADMIMKGTYKLVMNKDKCNQCGSCWMYCPLGVIHETEDGFFEIDHDYCRPCGICAHECPTGAIEFSEEQTQ